MYIVASPRTSSSLFHFPFRLFLLGETCLLISHPRHSLISSPVSYIRRRLPFFFQAHRTNQPPDIPHRLKHTYFVSKPPWLPRQTRRITNRGRLLRRRLRCWTSNSKRDRPTRVSPPPCRHNNQRTTSPSCPPQPSFLSGSCSARPSSYTTTTCITPSSSSSRCSWSPGTLPLL